MKIEVEFKVDLKTEAVQKAVEEATRLGLRDTIVSIGADAIKGTRKDTGNNMRSIFYGVSGMGGHKQSSPGRQSTDTWTGPDDSILDDRKIEGAVYSTSGYGGYLETGTVRMGARPYFRPALDRNAKDLPENIKRHLNG
uniref:Putative tail protein n=1 Tax=viral metagenome TaxID=1070528 RepID=A0A6M3M5M6_9ZZZZ